jgi:hypothetical protein
MSDFLKPLRIIASNHKYKYKVKVVDNDNVTVKLTFPSKTQFKLHGGNKPEPISMGTSPHAACPLHTITLSYAYTK